MRSNSFARRNDVCHERELMHHRFVQAEGVKRKPVEWCTCDSGCLCVNHQLKSVDESVCASGFVPTLLWPIFALTEEALRRVALSDESMRLASLFLHTQQFLVLLSHCSMSTGH